MGPRGPSRPPCNRVGHEAAISGNGSPRIDPLRQGWLGPGAGPIPDAGFPDGRSTGRQRACGYGTLGPGSKVPWEPGRGMGAGVRQRQKEHIITQS